MDVPDLVGEVSAAGLLSRAFTVVELVRAQDPFVGPIAHYEALQSALLADWRFVRLSGTGRDDQGFVFDVTLYRFFTDLNMRLAAVDEHRLSEGELCFAVNGLRSDAGWSRPPPDLVRWGRSLGLTSACCTIDQYVFPLARLLSCLPEGSLGVGACVLDTLGEKRVWDLRVEDLLEGCVQKGFSGFDQKTVDVVQARTGLLTGDKMTLADTGSLVGLSPERVRQLEARFWRRLRSGAKGRERTRAPFVAALLCDFMAQGGSLIVAADSRKGPLRRFLAKCVGIRQLPLRQQGMTVLGLWPEELDCLASSDWFPDEVEPDAIASRLDLDAALPLVDSDVKAVAESVAQVRRRRLKAPQRVYMALRDIERPAHYSEIAEAHNTMFPERANSESYIHGVLGRGKYGVVWIGVKGTYALQEWGYERPSQTLFETVTEIVERMHRRTDKPVPLSVVMAEIGKYRRIVKVSSVTIAAYCNDQLQCVNKDCFVPKGAAKEVDDGSRMKELDRILREFQEDRRSKDSTEDQGDSTGTEGAHTEAEEEA